MLSDRGSSQVLMNHRLPPIRELHTMMAYYANMRDDAEKREKMASTGVKLPVFHP